MSNNFSDALDEVYSIEHLDILLMPNEEIRQELKKYDWITINKFSELIFTNDRINAICLCKLPPIYFDSIENFWKTWNKFLQLKAFI